MVVNIEALVSSGLYELTNNYVNSVRKHFFIVYLNTFRRQVTGNYIGIVPSIHVDYQKIINALMTQSYGVVVEESQLILYSILNPSHISAIDVSYK